MGVQGAGTGGGVFILGEQPFQFHILFCPVILIREPKASAKPPQPTYWKATGRSSAVAPRCLA